VKILDSVVAVKADYQMKYYDVVTNPCWKCRFGHNSDFRTIMYDDTKFYSYCSRFLQISNFENSKWRTTAILKIVISPYFCEI